MLRFLCNIVLRVFIGSVLLIYTAILSGSFRHDPLIPLFTNPDGLHCEMPCLLGIRVGETMLEDAIALVQSHPMTYNLRLFEDDFITGLPTGRWGSAFHGSNWSVLFMGQSGNAVALQIYVRGDLRHILATGFDYQYPVGAVCLKSVFNNGTIELPPISAELALMWHKTSFLQMITTLGEPQSISSPAIAGTGVSFGSTRLESFYFDDQLVITHTNNTSQPPDFFHNFFDSVCIYANTDFNTRFNTGFHGRTGAIVPWLGLYASIQDYYDWIAENPATEPVRVMP
jgi:hypothetical protein